MSYRRIATFTGWLWILTFVTSIAARLFFYAPVLDNEGNYVAGAGSNAQTLIATGAVLELLLIISNVGTAVVPYSIHKRVHEAGAVAYVTARLVECTFIAIGTVCILALSTLRQDARVGPTPPSGRASLRSTSGRSAWGRASSSASERPDPRVAHVPFRLGPPAPCGVRAGRWAAHHHLGALVILDAIPAGGAVQVLATIPELIWELGIGIYLIVKGYRTSSPALAGTQEAPLV